MENLTPMMKQFVRVKNEYPDALILFRAGDFYETFYDDAKIASEALDIVLTARGGKGSKRVPLAGIPYHALDQYLSKLIKKGFKVAICEQLEDPKLAKGIVKRDVVRVVTPGTVIESNILDEGTNNYLAAIVRVNLSYGLAACDISTGEFTAASLSGDYGFSKLKSEMARFDPKECIVPDELYNDENFINAFKGGGMVINSYKDEAFIRDIAYKNLTDHFNTVSLDGFGCENIPEIIMAAGAIISYLRETQKTSLGYVNKLQVYSLSDFMVLDCATLENLELIKNARDGTKRGTLLSVLGSTITAGGSRLVKKWILKPLINSRDIQKRLAAVDALYNDAIIRGELSGKLRKIQDIERLTGRIAAGCANARDLVGLKNSLSIIPEVKKILSKFVGNEFLTLPDITGNLNIINDTVNLIERSIVADPPFSIREGGIIKGGVDDELDNLKSIVKDSKSWISELERTERQRTGIKSLKVGFNRVFGYYIEIRASHSNLVPDDYVRKQTLANAERFITSDLKEKESLILSADDKICDIEYKIFKNISEKISREIEIIREIAHEIAVVDVLNCFANTSAQNDYVKPEITDDMKVVIKGGRHPVVEKNLSHERFVPNDCIIDCDKNQLIILTGPNMAGKSTYIRQVALICHLAQIGCFVPADSARIGVVDRIFARIGASDDLSRGKSTFMVEMLEIANILNSATAKSLIILDETGRGTSTYDGMSIAWAVCEYILSTRIGAKTLFATHYHHLTAIENQFKGVKNYHIAVRQAGDDIVFLRKIVEGASDRSYGIEVAKLAGLPKQVIERAREVLFKIENEGASADIENNRLLSDKYERQNMKKSRQRAVSEPGYVQMRLAAPENVVVDELRGINIEGMTPVEALNKLYELQRKARDEN